MLLSPLDLQKKWGEDTLKFSCDKISVEREGCIEFGSECRLAQVVYWLLNNVKGL